MKVDKPLAYFFHYTTSALSYSIKWEKAITSQSCFPTQNYRLHDL